MIEAVIFDFDGVIADTMGDNCRAWQLAFSSYGFNLKAAEYYKLEGMGRYQIAQYFIDKYSLDPSIETNVVEAKELNYKKNNSFKLYDDIPNILSFLKQQKIPIAIVTGASKDRIEQHLEKKIKEDLSALVTSDDVTHTKPDPEPYLKAVKKIRKPSENCLVIENAILGIRSAKAAGCHCYALETTLSRDNLTMADEVFATHKELLDRLKTLFK